MMDLLTLAACVGVIAWGLVSLSDMALDALAARTACKHPDTAWVLTPEGIAVHCTACHAHTGTWSYEGVAA